MMSTIRSEMSLVSTLAREQAASTPCWAALSGRIGESWALVRCLMSFYWGGTNTDADIDDKSLQFARQNIQENRLQNRIKLLQTKPNDPLLPLDVVKLDQ